MDIPYHQMSPKEALGVYADWLLDQRIEEPFPFFRCLEQKINHIHDDPRLREKVDLGLLYLSHPLKARMSGVCTEPEESYGCFAVQATGFAGLSLAEAIRPDSAFKNFPQSDS